MYLFEVSTPRTHPKYPKKLFFQKYDFHSFYDFYLKKGPLGAHVDASINVYAYTCVQSERQGHIRAGGGIRSDDIS